MLTTKRRLTHSRSESQRFSSSSMKKSLVGPLLTVLVLIVLAAVYGYMYYQVNSQQKKMDKMQVTIAQDAQTVSGVVNFINSSLANTKQ